MNSAQMDTARWYQALNLSERAALPGCADTQTRDDRSERGRARLQRWQSQPQFAAADSLEARLQSDGLTLQDFERLLDEPAEALGQRVQTSPDWLEYIGTAYSSAHSLLAPLELSSNVKETLFARTLIAANPLIAHTRRALRADLETHSASLLALGVSVAGMEQLLYEALPRQLLSIASRTLVLEMHVLKLQQRLAGETPQDRFESFIEHLQSPQTSLALLNEYPVLARELVSCLRNWHTSSARLVANLCDDWADLVSMFPKAGAAGALIDIEAGAGDRHRGGRAVVILRFASGWKLVYKPRSLAVDEHFQRLLRWVNERTTGLQFRTFHTLTRPEHGWSEFIDRHTDLSASEAQRYFRRHGGYLALLYLLEATDFHYENLICAGEHPILIDLEALFQPRLQDERRNDASDVAGREMNYSVLRVGLLPQRLFTDGKREGLDVSGIGALAGQVTPFELPLWAAAGTDEMHLVRKQGTFHGSPNRPRIDGREVDPCEYMEDIVAGFEHVYRVLMEHRPELLDAKGPIAQFADDEVRVLLRATRTYARVIQESFHPDVLRDALDRDQLFDALWSRVEHLPGFEHVLAAERRELWNGDIPVFTARPGGRTLFTGDGRAIEGFFSGSSLELTCRQLQRLSEGDLSRQSWYIRAAMSTIAAGDIESNSVAAVARRRANPATPAEPLPLAIAIGERLHELAIRGERDASWIGLALVNSRSFDLAPLALDLYDGLPGVALFLAYLGKVTESSRHTELARAAVQAIRSQLPKARTFEKSVGAFSGWGGIIHLCTHLGQLWNEDELLAEAHAIVDALPPLIAADRNLDIIGGVAGCALTLLNVHRITGSEPALQGARLCGERLVETAERQDIGVGWMTNVPAPAPLAGFSHGVSGIAWALLELAAVTGDRAYRELAHEALAYERTLFSAEHNNWRDIRSWSRTDSMTEKFQYAWCHGAPGIGLSRMLMLRHLQDPVIRSEARRALTSTLSHGIGGTHCLCHGALGNIDTVLLADQVFGKSGLGDEPVSRVLNDVATSGPRCANPAGIESPGLMTGLAGIGYGLLRLAAPAIVPSVLTLAPPAATSREELLAIRLCS
nr:type 2 lanthipeptide synthetase LanM family protein [uncultured Steroidobacter sp.]